MSFNMEPGIKIRGRYEIGRALGQGGLGHSYLAKDLYRSEDVVIKVIGIGTESRWTALRPWDDALSRLRRLSHGGVPSILDQFSFDEEGEGYVALVQEYVKGQSLSDIIGTKGPLSTELCRDLAMGLLDTLDYLHSQKVPHGAVRPAAVFFEDPEHLQDSQLAGFVLLNHIAHRLGQRDAYGSASAYIRPQMYQEENISPEGDTFSLAMTLFFALTGQQPPTHPDALADFHPEEQLGPGSPWVDFMEECFQGDGDGHFHRLRDLVPTISSGGYSSGRDSNPRSGRSAEDQELRTYTGEVVEEGTNLGNFTYVSAEDSFILDGEVIAQNGHISYDGRRKLDALPEDMRNEIEAQIEGQRNAGLSNSTWAPPGQSGGQGSISSEKVEVNGKAVMENGQVTQEALGELDKLPAFLRDKVLQAIKEKSGGERRTSTEDFDTIKGRIGTQVGLTASSDGFSFSIPKSWVNYFLGFFTLGIGTVFGVFFLSIIMEDFADFGPIGFVFLIFGTFPLMGIISVFGKSVVELRRDKIIRKFMIFGIQTLRREIPLSEIRDVFINRVRGSKGGVTHYLCIQYNGGKVNIGSGMGGVDKHRQDILDLVRAWWLENKR
jgi:serine/threonine protein kinase